MAKNPPKKAKSPLQRTPMRKLAAGLRNELLQKLREKNAPLDSHKPKK
jgi:hypothetical protein